MFNIKEAGRWVTAPKKLKEVFFEKLLPTLQRPRKNTATISMFLEVLGNGTVFFLRRDRRGASAKK